MPTFVYRGRNVVSVTDPYGRILGFLDRILNIKLKFQLKLKCKAKIHLTFFCFIFSYHKIMNDVQYGALLESALLLFDFLYVQLFMVGRSTCWSLLWLSCNDLCDGVQTESQRGSYNRKGVPQIEHNIIHKILSLHYHKHLERSNRIQRHIGDGRPLNMYVRNLLKTRPNPRRAL
jgi:hypothetical protein